MPQTDMGVLLFIGAIFFLIGLLGGGFEISAIKIPAVGKPARFISSGIGIIFMGIAVSRLVFPSPFVQAGVTPTATYLADTRVAVKIPTKSLSQDESSVTPTDTPTLHPTRTPAPTNTPLPAPTNTPRPTPAPTATIDADPTVYDNFNNPAFDESFNQSQWQYQHDQQRQVAQQGGILVLTHDPKTDTVAGLTAQRYRSVTLEKLTNMTPTFWEAKMMLDANKHDGNVQLNLGARLPNGSDWFSQCIIDDDGGVGMNCWDTVWPWEEEHHYTTEWKPVALGTWHTVRIELDPTTMTITYYIDGDLFGSHAPSKAEELKNAIFSLEIGSWGESGEETIGQFDYIRIGPVE